MKKLTEQEALKMWSFIVESLAFTDEQTAAVDHQIPMTQETFDSILERCEKIGTEADFLFFRMLEEYPQFLEKHLKEMEKEIESANIKPLSKEESEIQRQKLLEAIQQKYRENKIR